MNVVIRAQNRSIEFESGSASRILHSALSSGVDLPHECISGTCGSCKARLTRGTVRRSWTDAPALALLKPDEYLLCQCEALNDCEFEVTGIVEKKVFNTLPCHYRGLIGNQKRLGPDVSEFTVHLDTEIAFDAGQFVALSFPEVRGERCYSMVNADSPTRSLRFVIKHKPGGAVSNWLLDPNRVGSEIGCFGPVGKATYDPRTQGDILCVAGGSGIAGIMSILARAVENKHFARHKGYVYFGLRSAKDAFFLNEMDDFASAFQDSLHITVALSEEITSDLLRTTYPALAFGTGMVHEVACQTLLSPMSKVSAFVAGPPGAVTATLRALVLQLKIDPTSIKYDKFG